MDKEVQISAFISETRVSTLAAFLQTAMKDVMTSSIYDNLHTTKHAGKVALITGGNSGLGLATAQRLAREGAQIIITGRRQDVLDEALTTLPAGAMALQGDVTVEADMARIVQAVVAAHGRIDIVFANAGVAEFVSLGAITEAQMDRTFGINVKGVVLTLQAALPHIPRGGAIVVTGSICAIQGVSAFSIYAASKAALRSFTRSFASDLKGSGIRINLVAPGVVVTPGYENELKMTPEQIASYCEEIAAQAPLGRVGQGDDIAKAVSFLASDDASYITGVELFVDGGLVQV